MLESDLIGFVPKIIVPDGVELSSPFVELNSSPITGQVVGLIVNKNKVPTIAVVKVYMELREEYPKQSIKRYYLVDIVQALKGVGPTKSVHQFIKNKKDRLFCGVGMHECIFDVNDNIVGLYPDVACKSKPSRLFWERMKSAQHIIRTMIEDDMKDSDAFIKPHRKGISV